VRAAGEVATELLWRLAPHIAQRLPESNADAVIHEGELEFATALSQRMVSYLGRLVDNRGSRR
jgi:hypothetical protein